MGKHNPAVFRFAENLVLILTYAYTKYISILSS